MYQNRHASEQRRVIWPPEAGYFALALVRGGWRVPARIVRDDNGWSAEVDSEMQLGHPDPALATMLANVWHGGMKISEADYRWLLAIKDHARQHDPDHPCLSPRKKIDPRRLKPFTFEDTTR